MTYTASDVPGRIDVLIDGQGYRFLETDEVKGISSFAPTFLQRTNVSDAYGDEDQDWWLTMTQRDWSLGEGQRFLSVRDDASPRRFWRGTDVDISEPGFVRIARGSVDTTHASVIKAICQGPTGDEIYVMSSSNLYTIQSGGALTDLGAHGVTNPNDMCHDTVRLRVYMAGTTAVRKYTASGTTFAAFSGSGASRIAHLNNTLYGCTDSALYRFDTAGTRSTLFTWQSADGTAGTWGANHLAPYGGDLLIGFGGSGQRTTCSLWIYDGVAPGKVAEFPPNFTLSGICVLHGVAFCGGVVEYRGTYRFALYVFANGSLTRIWQSDENAVTSAATRGPAICSFNGGIVWNDDARSRIMFYDPDTGAVSTLFSNSSFDNDGYYVAAACNNRFAFISRDSDDYVLSSGSAYASTATIKTSLFDGDSTRTKRFKSVVVEFDAGSGGNGGSVDIAYRLNDVDGSYTSLQTGATSGTEYAIGQNGRAISIQVTLNLGTSTTPPQLKRIYVRAAPILDTFRKERYVLDLTGVDGEQHLTMRDGITVHPKDGLAMATDLRTAIASTSPITIVDEFGSYSAFLVPEECEIRRVRSQEYTAVITAREV